MYVHKHKFSIDGLSEKQHIKLGILLEELANVHFMEHSLPPKSNWAVYSDTDAKKAHAAALEAAIEAAMKAPGSSQNSQVWVMKNLEQSISSALRAAHFSEPLHGPGKKSVAARAAYERAEIEGLYLARDYGTKIAQTVGKAAGAAGLMIATEDLNFQNNEKEEALRESNEYIEALRRGYLMVGSVDGVYYVACVGQKNMNQLFKEMKGLLGEETRK